MLGALAALSLCLGACADPASPSTQRVDVVATAATATTAVRTAEIDTTTTMTGSAPYTDRLVYDFTRQVGEVLPPSEPGTGTAPQIILDGATVYLNIGSGLLPDVDLHGRIWLEEQPSHGRTSNQSLTDLVDPTMPATNAATLLDHLAPLVTAVKQVGPASVDGIDTTEYQLTISAKGQQDLTGITERGDIKAFQPVYIWIDQQQRMRQIRLSFSVPQTGQVTITSDYVNFGIPVNVTIPAPSQIETLTQYRADICTSMKNQSRSGPSGAIGIIGSGSAPITGC